MTHNKNNIPIYQEEQIINQEEVNIQQILNQFKQLVPVNFVKLEIKDKNYMCSTQGWKEPVCERYIFFYRDKSIQFDIPQELMAELELEKGRDIRYPVYISSQVLKRQPIQLGITIENKEEIFIQKPLTINNLEQELTNWLNELKNSREKVNKLTADEQLSQELAQENQLLKIELQGEKQSSQAQKETNQAQINELTTERNNIQQKLTSQQTKINNLENEIEQSNNTLQTTQQERDQIQGDLDNLRNEYRRISWKFLNSWFRKNEKSKKIVDLKVRIVRLGAELFDKDRQITDLQNNITTRNQTITNLNNQVNQLTTQKDNLQTWANDLNQQLVIANASITNKDNEITELNTLITNIQNLLGINNLNNLPELPEGETLDSLLARPTPNKLQTEQNRVKDLERQNDILQQERDARPNITPEHLNQLNREINNLRTQNNDYSRRPTQQQLTNLQNELNNVRERLNSHACSPCNMRHYSPTCNRPHKDTRDTSNGNSHRGGFAPPKCKNK